MCPGGSLPSHCSWSFLWAMRSSKLDHAAHFILLLPEPHGTAKSNPINPCYYSGARSPSVNRTEPNSGLSRKSPECRGCVVAPRMYEGKNASPTHRCQQVRVKINIFPRSTRPPDGWKQRKIPSDPNSGDEDVDDCVVGWRARKLIICVRGGCSPFTVALTLTSSSDCRGRILVWDVTRGKCILPHRLLLLLSRFGFQRPPKLK